MHNNICTSIMASFTAEEQHAYIKIEFYKGSTSTEIFNTLQTVCGNQALSHAAVFRWVPAVKEGRNEVEKKSSPGRPVEATNSDHIAKVREIIEKDRRFTCDEIVKKLVSAMGQFTQF